jgi:hypothetical protein
MPWSTAIGESRRATCAMSSLSSASEFVVLALEPCCADQVP